MKTITPMAICIIFCMGIANANTSKAISAFNDLGIQADPKLSEPEFRVAQPQKGYTGHKSVISEKIKDILSECSNTGAPSDVYVSLNSSGSVVVERNGIMLRVFTDPAVKKELYKIFSDNKEVVEDSWEEQKEELSADGLLKKICRYFFQKVCEWISCPYPNQPQDEYHGCVRECKIRITPLGCQNVPANRSRMPPHGK